MNKEKKRKDYLFRLDEIEDYFSKTPYYKLYMEAQEIITDNATLINLGREVNKELNQRLREIEILFNEALTKKELKIITEVKKIYLNLIKIGFNKEDDLSED